MIQICILNTYAHVFCFFSLSLHLKVSGLEDHAGLSNKRVVWNKRVVTK